MLEELLAGADVVVTGYRPGALDRFGLAPEALAAAAPGAGRRHAVGLGVPRPVGRAAGLRQPGAGRVRDRGRRGAADAPGALPAQALDHVTGYLVAAAALLTLARQRRDGGSHLVRLSLVGTAAWLQRLPRAAAEAAEVDPAPYLVELDAPDGRLTLAAPPGTVDGRPLSWPDPPPSFGTAEPRWVPANLEPG